MKAPIASAIGTPEVAASSAAPGVDQAVSTGWRVHRDRPRLVRPMPMPSAQIQEVVWASVAPSCWVAWKMMATELVKPTSTATKPATVAERDRSFRARCMVAGAYLSGSRP